jgi:hypothetical protein
MSRGVRLRRVTPWPYNDPPAGFSLPDFGLSPQDHGELTDRIWLILVHGYDDAEGFIESYLDEDCQLTEEQVATAFDLSLAARRAQQAQWTSSPGARLEFQGDGNLVIYAWWGPAIWASHTAQ